MAIAGSVIGAIVDVGIAASLSTGTGALVYIPLIGFLSGGTLGWKLSPKILNIANSEKHADRIRVVSLVNSSSSKLESEDQLFDTAQVLQSALESISKLPSKTVESTQQSTLP